MLVAAIVRDPNSAPIPDREKLLYGLIDTVVTRRGELAQELFDNLAAAGWSDGEMYEALTVCALFCFYNAWVDGAGGEGVSQEAYAASGKRLAQNGYSP